MAIMAQSLNSTFLQGTPFTPVLQVHRTHVNKVRNFRVSVTCRKKDIHPEFYEDSKVYCNGELVMVTGGTQKEYVVDVWSGNHPFYLGDRSALVAEVSQVEKFRQKYPDLKDWLEIPVLKGEIKLPPRRKPTKPGKKK